jgi:YidC/Oxa1 family membrane protein insertase
MPFITAGIEDTFESILSPLISVFQAILIFFHDTVGIGWGLAIIAMTVVVRIVLLPLTIKQFRSMQALQTLSPQIKDLQAKYKGDKQRLNQEMMKFYQENKVNPFGSCLPLIAQIPVFISLFYLLRAPLKVDICGPESAILEAGRKATPPTGLDTTYCQEVIPGSAEFLFIPDLTAPALGWVLILLLVLYVVSQLLSSLLMSVTSDRNQKIIMIALPFVFVFFIKGFPAGLMVYWITTNFWTVGQQYFLKRATGQLPPWLGGNPDGLPSAPAAVAATVGGGSSTSQPSAPPPAARKKKKRSGKRS